MSDVDQEALLELAHELGFRLILACAISRAAGLQHWQPTQLRPDDMIGGLLDEILFGGPQLEGYPGLHEPLAQLLRTREETLTAVPLREEI